MSGTKESSLQGMNPSGSAVIRRAYAPTRRGQMHYAYAGEGEALILLHHSAGWFASWSWMMPDLAGHCRCLAVDTPGFGMSDPPPETSPTVADYARCFVSLMDALDIERAHLYGHHTGASIAVELAAAYPDRVAKLMLNGIPHFDMSQEELVRAVPRLRNYFSSEPLREDGAHLRETWDTISDMGKAMGAFSSPLDAQALWLVQQEVLAKLLAGKNTKALYSAIWEYDIFGRLGDVRAPTMVWSGELDPLRVNHDRAVAQVPGARSVTGPGGTEFATHLDATELVRSIVDFLNEPLA